ncbi:sensor domain-containing diguanylate cyclase [Lysinibacillus sphaericus]
MTKSADRLHIYKSKLFDLIHDDMSIDLQQTDRIQRWLRLLKESPGIDKAFLYHCRNNEYCLQGSTEEQVISGTLRKDIIGPSFKDAPYFIEGFRDSLFHSWFQFRIDDEETCVLLIQHSDRQPADEEWVSSFWKASDQFLRLTRDIRNVYEEERRYRELFKVTEFFHSNRDVQTLLVQIIETLGEVFPEDQFRLLLSNDRYDFGSLPIKSFDFEKANPFAMQAFVNGSIELDEETSMLYAPLRGKQGIYGVLEVGTTAHMQFNEQKIEFIKLLAYTAGSALENAKLYEQSKRLISDLQLINETSHQLNLKFRLSDTLMFLKNQIERSFQPSAIGFLLKESNDSVILEQSSSLFFTDEGKKYISYVNERINKERDSIFLGDVSDRIGDPGYLSLMAVPMIQNEELIGFCVVLHQDPYMFSFDMYKLLQSFIHHSALAITNATLREELEHMVITDHMTKLYARHYLDGKMESAMNDDDLGTLLLIDIDDFKAVNDNYGHQVGDEVLIQTAAFIKEVVGGSGSAARWGGEEIAVYLPFIERDEGYAIAEAIVEAVSCRTEPGVTLSCGLSSWLKGDERCPSSVKELVKKADEALYIAKNHGKNQVVVDLDARLLLKP